MGKHDLAGAAMLRRNILLTIAAIAIVAFSLAPILWQVATSLKTNADIAAVPNVYIPQQLTLEHYAELFERRPFWRYALNSALVATISTSLSLGLGAPAAYALARLRLPGKRSILVGILAITLFPYVTIFLGLLEMVRALGWGNTYLATIVPYTALNLPLTILVVRSFFEQLPRDLEDAARIDGYGLGQILLKIILPLTAPALSTSGILVFMFSWNEFILALTFITQDRLKTIPVAIAQLGGASVFEIPYGPIAAATVLGTLPLVALVLAGQRQIVKGLTAGAVKG